MIVEPLRQKSKDRQRAIIGQYECANIFMNIDELAAVTQDFYNDLIQYGSGGKNLGDLCLSHVSSLLLLFLVCLKADSLLFRLQTNR